MISAELDHVDADGNKESTSGKVRFDTDGGGVMSPKKLDADGNKENIVPLSIMTMMRKKSV